MGGLFSFRKELICRLVQEKYDVYIMTPQEEDRIKTAFQKMGATCIICDFDRAGISVTKDMQLFFRFCHVIRDLSPACVLTYTIKPCVYCGLACRMLRTPYIGTITGINPKVFNGKLRTLAAFLYRLGLKGAECVFFQNEGNRELFKRLRIKGKKERLVYGSGVNLQEHCFEEYPANSDKIRFLFLGRIIRAKGIVELCSAIRQVRKTYSKSEVEFVFCGFKEEEIDIFNEMSKNGEIEWPGPVQDVHSQLRVSHALIMPSYAEGMSNVLLEAAATGRPVLASDIPGCRETFQDQIGGYAFTPGNVESLADSILKFIQLPNQQKEKMGLEARKYVESVFDRNKVVEHYINEIVQCEETVR